MFLPFYILPSPLMFHMEQSGTHSESTSVKRLSAKNSQQRVDLHIRISKENYIFLKENFRNRFSETIDKLLDSLRTGDPVRIEILRIGGYEWVRPDSNRRPPACEAGVITTRPRTLKTWETVGFMIFMVAIPLQDWSRGQQK